MSVELVALAQSVGQGKLRLEAGTAETCVRACSDLLDILDRVLHDFAHGQWRAQFGDFQAGIQLADKYELLAVGSDVSFDRVLQGHIDVVVRMREVFEAAGKAYGEAEVQNVAAFGSVGESLGG